MQTARLHPTVNKRHQLPLCFGAETSYAGQERENEFQPREDAEVLHLFKSFLVYWDVAKSVRHQTLNLTFPWFESKRPSQYFGM